MDAKMVPDIVRANSVSLDFNCEAIDIFSGNIKPHVLKLIKEQLSPQSAYQALHRAAPINVLPKVIDKMTNIYQTSVIRTVTDDSESDKKLVGFYEKNMRMNVKMNCANELFNLCSANLLQPYVYNRKPALRPIKNDRFVVYSENPVEPDVPTHVILIYRNYDQKPYYWVYSDQEIYAVNEKGEVDLEIMRSANMYNLLGEITTVNPVGKIPFIYGNSSEYCLVPPPDDDGLTIVKLIPVMLTDLNHAAMFQCFSILYLINAQQAGLKFSPNAVWELNQPPGSDAKPEVGQIKPNVDYDQVLNLISTELSMWLGTRGIRASSIDGLTKDNFASGISKVIDEMDTFEARQKQVTSFQKIESDLWSLITDYLHPYWIKANLMDNIGLFTPGMEVNTQFAVQLPMQTRGQVVTDLALEVQSGFISRKRAIMKLNPELSDKEVDDLMEEITAEHSVNVLAENQSGSPQEPNPQSTPPAQ